MKPIKCKVCREIIEEVPSETGMSVASKRVKERLCWVCSHLLVAAVRDVAAELA